MMTTMHKSKTAIATRIDGALYDVAYVGGVEQDQRVPYSYLERLAKAGYEVRIQAGRFGPATTIPAETAGR
jgi:hypothetical protein